MEPRIQYAKMSDGISIAYWTMGEGEPLVHVPLPFSHIQLELQIPEMRRWYEALAREHTLVRYDHRGFGLSDRTTVDLSLPTQVGDLEALIEKLGFETFALFGPLLMGPIAIEYAARHPEKVSHLFLWCSWASYSDYLRSPRTRALVALRDQDWETYTEAVAHTMLGWAEGEPSSRYAALMRESVSAEAVRDGLERKGDKLDVTARLERVKSPTLVLHRREVVFVDVEVARGLASRIPDAQLALLEGDSAAPFLGDTQAVLDSIADFLGDGHREVAQASTPAPSGDASQTQISSPPETRTFASGRYAVKRLLGQGAQKSVYLVEDTVLDRECALSVLNAALLDPSDVDRIKREAQTMAQLGTQPNIVTVHDYGEEDGAPFIVCEYVPGGELRDELAAAAGPLPLERALAVATDICRALSFAHGRNIVHRDIKPENVWLTEERSAKLGDFGIALTMGRTRLTMPGGVTGTAAYMAPEQASGGDVDARSDLYAFGALLYELVTGRPPFVGDDPNAIIYQHINTKPDSPVEHNPSLPPGLERMIMRLLAKPKTERPASAEEVLAELERAAAELAEGQPGTTATVRDVPASSPIEQEIRFCTSADGTRIAYATYGEPGARALVFVQSFEMAQELFWKNPGTRALYEGIASGRRLVTFDCRGVGSSQRDVDDLAIPAQVTDLAAVVDQLGLGRFDLMGRSMGALAVAYAVEYPDQVGRLLLWHPVMRTHDSPIRGFQELAQSIRANWSLARRSWAAISYPNGPIDVQRWYSNMLRDSVAQEVAARHLEVIAEVDARAILGNVRAPTLVLTNSGAHHLEVATVRAVASLIPDARLVTLEGDLGTQFVDPSQAIAAIRNFLDEADAAPEAVEPQPAT